MCTPVHVQIQSIEVIVVPVPYVVEQRARDVPWLSPVFLRRFRTISPFVFFLLLFIVIYGYALFVGFWQNTEKVDGITNTCLNH